jgi:hypothetical protein
MLLRAASALENTGQIESDEAKPGESTNICLAGERVNEEKGEGSSVSDGTQGRSSRLKT